MKNTKKQKYLKNLRDNPLSLGELAKIFSQSKTQTKNDIKSLKQEGVNVFSEKIDGITKYYIPLRPPQIEEKKVDIDYFGLISDSHLGSKYCEEECLQDIYDIFEEEGVKVIFHAGDLVDGVEVYQGQLTDLKRECITLQDQIDYVIKNYPRKRDIKTKIIAGNHDLKEYKRQGVDPVKQVCDKRKDMVYLGQFYGRIRLKDGVLMEISHPTGQSAYSKEYKFRTYLRERPISTYPDILVLGHYHSSIMEDIQGTISYMPGCFLGDTEYTRRKGLNPSIGGWIVELKIEDGKIKRNKSEWIFY